MPGPDWQNLKEIFHSAVVLSQHECEAYLDQACKGDLSLRRQVEELLRSHQETGNLVDAPAYQAAAEMLIDGVELKAGSTVAHYRILSLLGEGGMGRVYLAEDTKLHRKVSLKFLSADVTQDHERVRRFEQEARAASALNQPNIITIHEIGEEDGHQFIATEFIDGQTLRERLRSPLDLDESLEIAIQVASALAAAHRVNIVHRDIKPENIMIRKDDGLVKVLDFGLAKMSVLRRATMDPEADTQLRNTAPGVVMGTVAYMSPEQARGEIVDERTDIWSLGVVLYEMVAGSSPFVASTSNEIISAILSRETPAPLKRYSHVVPERLEEIVEKALTKNKDERYQTTKDLLIDLKRLKQTLQLKAASERSTSPDRIVPAATDGQTAVLKAETNAASTPQASSAEYIVNQVRSQKRAALVSLVMLLFVATAVGIYVWQLRQTSSIGQSAITSVAVLPLVNQSSDPETEYLADGITDNVIERMSQIANLKVMAHSAVFHYKGKDIDPRAVGRELGVAAVLTGRIVKRNDSIEVNLELVNAKDNSRIWGQQYNRELSDLVSMQREIPLDVSDKLRLQLSGESKERLMRAYTANSEAYQLYLKGRHSWEKWTEVGARQAVQFFEEAIKKDPNYALAYSGLADAYLFGPGVGQEVPQKEAHRRARAAAMKALSLDPQLGEAHASVAEVLLYDDWDFAGAEREFKRALELNPGYAEGHHQYSHLLLLLGRTSESLIESNKFLELDPISEPPIGHLGYHYLYSRQYDEAIKTLQKTIHLYPDTPQYTKLGNAFFEKGMYREAVDVFAIGLAKEGLGKDDINKLNRAFEKAGSEGWLRKFLEILKAAPGARALAVNIAEIHARLGEKDQAFEWLENAYADHSDGLVRLKEEIGFDNLRSDPRYADLARRIGLPQ